MNILRKPPLGLKARGSKKNAKRLAAVAELPCVICHEFSEPQVSPTQVHHCIHGRHAMSAKAPDSMTIPLCEGHHLGDFDTTKIALHREPKKWREAYGSDVDWLSWVDDRLSKSGQKLLIRGVCLADGCERCADHVGFCKTHYRRVLTKNTTEIEGTEPGAPKRWLEENARHDGSECLPWPFSRLEGYYSLALPGGRWTKVHRYMCALRHGPAPDGMYAIHSCGNRSCVNPNHLRWGTPSANAEDARKHGTLVLGDLHPHAKLTEKMVAEIRARLNRGEPVSMIARDYPATYGTVWAAAKRKTWRHVK